MNFLKKILIKITNRKEIQQINKNLAKIIVNQIISLPKFQNEKNLLRYGYKVFSQQDEDGIIDEIFERIGYGKKSFVEMGLETGVQSNTTNLLLQNWSGLWIESNTKSVDKIKQIFSDFLKKTLKVHCEKINPNNVNQILLNYYNKNEEVDLLSIDIGVHTFHVLDAISLINPRVIVTEYNAKYGPIINWTVDYNQNSEWDGSDYFGGSLKAFEVMLSKKNYALVGCNVTGVNAFFVRKDQLKDKFEENVSSKFHFIDGKYWLKNAFDKDYKIRIK